ncbi:MAG: hypothetical protein IKG56_01020 [Clostridia bacterium]|nr:hypothetical protein [Clostridia bacterium]
MEEHNENEKKIEIVEGDPKDLNISKVKDNLAFEIKEKDQKKDNIIVPKNK